jgi:hypothetical protein
VCVCVCVCACVRVCERRLVGAILMEYLNVSNLWPLIVLDGSNMQLPRWRSPQSVAQQVLPQLARPIAILVPQRRLRHQAAPSTHATRRSCSACNPVKSFAPARRIVTGTGAVRKWEWCSSDVRVLTIGKAGYCSLKQPDAGRLSASHRR